MKDAALPDGWNLWSRPQAYKFRATARATQQFSAFSGVNEDAATALTRWFREECVESWTSVWINLVDGRVAAFVAIQSGSVRLERADVKRLGFPDARVPASFITHLARDEGFPGYGSDALLWAASIVRRVNQLQRTAVMVLDPYDDSTEQMWRERFDFRPALEKTRNGCRRLYMTVPSPVPDDIPEESLAEGQEDE